MGNDFSEDVHEVREDLRNREGTIPSTVPIDPLDKLLETGAKSGRWEYEWGVLRHPIAA
jgi:hypothetical protein